MLARGVPLVAQATPAIAVATVRARAFIMAFIPITSFSTCLCNACARALHMSRSLGAPAKSFALKELAVTERKDELYGRTYQRQTLPSAVDVIYCACSGWLGGSVFVGDAITPRTLATVRPTASEA